MGDKSRLENNNLILQNITNTVMNMPDYVEIKNQDINVTENGLYTANTGYTGLGTVTVNVSSGEGDVKLFDSIANMQADPNPTEGDLAIVYYSTGGNLTAETEFQVATFPETVTLPSAITNSVNLQFKAVDETVMFDCMGSIRGDRFSMNCYMDGGNIRIEYTSSDGINYTRSRFQKNQEEISGTEMDFGTTIIFGSRWGEPTWNDTIGYFIQTGVTAFEGLYQYTNNSYSLAPTQFTADNRYVLDKSFYGVNGIDTGTLQNVENLTLDEVRFKAQVFSDLSYLTPSNDITDMSNMFNSNYNLTSVPNLDTGNVTNMANMFVFCNHIMLIPNFDTSNVTDMTRMFCGCRNLTSVPSFNMSNVININNMFINCDNLSNDSYINIVNSVPIANQVSTSMINIIGLSVNKFTSEEKNILFDKGYLDCDQNTSSWSTQYNFYNGVSWTAINRGDDYDRYGQVICNEMKNSTNDSSVMNRDVILTSIGIDNGILLSANALFYRYYTLPMTIRSCNIQINTVNIWTVSHMFEGCKNLKTVSNFNTSNVRNMGAMFRDCYNLTSVPEFDTNNVTSMSAMFYSCCNLTSVPNFNTNKVTDMSSMFYWCNHLTTVPNFDTSNVNNTVTMFYWCSNLTSVPNFDTSNVNNMRQMFSYCTHLTNVPNFDTSNVTDMFEMFSYCQNLTTVPNFDTSNVTSMYSMFVNCYNIITVPDFDTSNITNMTRMFYNCYNLTAVPNFNTSNITNMTIVFGYCHNLTTVPNLDLRNVEITTELFSQCNSLTTVPNFDLSNAKITAWMFHNCQNLTNIPNFNISNVTNMALMFYNCRKLTSIPNFDTSNVTVIGQVFSNCVNLTTVPELNSMKFTSMSAMFTDCNNLSNESIQNIVNMCINSNIANTAFKNLSNTNSFGPLYNTKFDNSYYQNRWAELDAAGWTY